MWLAKAIQSVKAQTDKNWEYIISDDGSDDSTYMVVMDAKQDDHRIHFVRSPQNKGNAFAIKRGIEASTGDYFCLLSDDDAYSPQYVRNMRYALDENPDVGIVYCDTRVEYIDGIFGGEAGWTNELTCPPAEQLIMHNVVNGFMMRRSEYDRIGGWPTRFQIANDWDFFLNAYMSGVKFMPLHQPLYTYRYWIGGLTYQKRRLQLDESMQIMQWHRQNLYPIMQNKA